MNTVEAGMTALGAIIILIVIVNMIRFGIPAVHTKVPELPPYVS